MHLRDDMVRAICLEIEKRATYLTSKNIDSIYFGGGTPSVLEKSHLQSIFSVIKEHFIIESNAEITLEGNPDDLSLSYMEMLRETGVNRLSIGVQSFFDKDLEWMNRIHSAAQSREVIRNARTSGFEDFSIDLIFGSPATTHEMWQANLETAAELGIPHLSCYALTVEKGTALHHFIKNSVSDAPGDKHQSVQFEMADRFLTDNGYVHYEISNYARPGRFAIHNTSYWQQIPYLGIGPSAHSFDGDSRQWNIAHNKKYIDAIHSDGPYYTREILTVKERFNEYLMTGLRTSSGCSWKKLEEIDPLISGQLQRYIKQYNRPEALHDDGECIRLAEDHRVIADDVISDLFIV